MKYFLINTLFVLLFSACSYQNAFTKFNMSSEEELIATNSQSSKIETKNGVIGILNAVYINNTDRIYFDKEEYFLVSVYMKNEDEEYSFKLNNQEPLEVKELHDVKEFTTYIKNPKEWEKYYILSFKKSSKKLDFILVNKGYDSSILHFQKY